MSRNENGIPVLMPLNYILTNLKIELPKRAYHHCYPSPKDNWMERDTNEREIVSIDHNPKTGQVIVNWSDGFWMYLYKGRWQPGNPPPERIRRSRVYCR